MLFGNDSRGYLKNCVSKYLVRGESEKAHIVVGCEHAVSR